MTDVQDPTREFRELDERRHATGLTPEEQARWDELRPLVSDETTGVIWEQGPVEQPPEPFPDVAPWQPASSADPDGPPPLPPADPDFEAVLTPEPEAAIPEVSAEDVEELSEPAFATVAVVEEDAGADGEVVSLDVLGATPPPLFASSLAPPLPPPAASPPPIPSAPPPVAAAPPPEPDPFAVSPSFVSGEHRVVLHTVEGQVLRGSLAHVDLADPELPLLQPNGAVARIPATGLKAVFFMLAPGDRLAPATGTRVRVTFEDGRQLSGLSPGYSPGAPGFFVLPLDTRTHTARVWVFRAATRQVVAG